MAHLFFFLLLEEEEKGRKRLKEKNSVSFFELFTSLCFPGTGYNHQVHVFCRKSDLFV